MPSSSVLGALDASEKTESVESTCDDLESIGEPSDDDNTSASGSAATRGEEGTSQRRVAASAPAGRDRTASGGRPDASGSFRVGSYSAPARAFEEVIDPWVGLEQYNIDRLMGA